MDADLIIRRRVVFAPNDFAEFVIWRVPAAVPPTTHGYMYRLIYVVEGARIIGFDNERGKGDHRHDDGVESRYEFVDVDRLLADFVEAIERWRLEHDRD